jgi:hypothetical protein
VDIGEPRKIIHSEPIEDPAQVPEPERETAPAAPQREREPVPA